MTSLAEPHAEPHADTITADVCMAELTDWAHHHPNARFAVVAIAPDGSDGVPLGWGLALPDHAFAYLPMVGVSGCFRSAHTLLERLRRRGDARLIWIDPEPDPAPDDPEDERNRPR